MPDGQRDRDPRFDRLVEEQAALRRVATLVARGVSPEDLFSAVSVEVGRLFGADAVIARYEADGSAMVVMGLTEGIPVVTVGTRWELEDFLASTAVYRTGRPARNDHTGHHDASGPVADSLRQMHFVSTVATPILVEGAVWGVMTVSDKRKRLPPDTEERVERFTELVATAIANADSRWVLGRLVEEQAALRRVATLVARGVSPAEVFEAVSVEVAGLFGAESGVARFEPDGAGMVLVGLSAGMRGIPIGTRWPLEDFLACTEVHRTRRPARSERSGWEGASGPAAEALRQMNPVSMVAAPIVVEGDLWGVITLADTRKSLPANAEERIEKFTELVATAIANAESRAELAASEARARDLAQEQAALRRVATLAAKGASADELCATVARQAAGVVDLPVVCVLRFDSDGLCTVVGVAGETTCFTVGSRWPVENKGVAGLILATGRPARQGDYAMMPGPVGEAVRADGMTSTVGVPIVVEGTVWGSVVGAARLGKLIRDGTEDRLARFTELVATAIANSQARDRLAQVASEQAALRRVATMVAQGSPPADVFAEVAEAVGEFFGVEAAQLFSYEPDGHATILATRGELGRDYRVGSRFDLEGKSITAQVYRTARPARIDDYQRTTGSLGAGARKAGMRCGVGSPIVVDGRLWGTLTVGTTRPELMPRDAESRLAEFTELVATAISNVEARTEVERLAYEQSALRRVATLVARAPASEQLFSTVAREVASVLDVPGVIVTRYDADGTALTVGEAFGPDLAGAAQFLGIGTPMPPDPGTLTALVFDTHNPARVDDLSTSPGTVGEVARAAELGSGCAGPIIVNGAVWGKMCVFSRTGTVLPAGTESRLHDFVELVATAIANYEARAELAASEARARGLAEEQAALRRVATLVARGAAPSEVFGAVSREIGWLLGSNEVAILRYMSGGSEFVVVGGTDGLPEISRERRWPLDDYLASAEVYRTSRPARRDHGSRRSAAGPLDDLFSLMRPMSTVAIPIVVEGQLWGCVTVSTGGEPLPPDAEERAGKFTELVATAIANANSREELAVSRARIIAAADDARRRIERDLHDGAQQRLVTLAVALRRAEAKVPAGLDDLRGEVTRVAEGLTSAVDELRELSRGIHPSILTEGGLSPALKALGRRSPVRVKLDVGFEHRLPDHVEVAAYYTVSEALTNASKHANAMRVWVSLRVDDELLRLSIRDDGVGGADASRGSGLTGLRDRIEALGGNIQIVSPPEGGTNIQVRIPIHQASDLHANTEQRPPPVLTPAPPA